MKTVTIADIESSVGFEIHPEIRERILRDRLTYSTLKGAEYETYILEYLKVLAADLSKTGKHRKEDWERGWEENLVLFRQSRDINDLIPKYHTKANIARLNKRIIKTFHPQFDFKLHSYMVDAILFKYLIDFSRVYEFGCGTGYHLYRLQQTFQNHRYFGLDWSKASQDVIAEASSLLNVGVAGHNFDYFNPDFSFDVEGGLVYTVASLEQIGDKHGQFVDYLIAKKPGLCIHFEPISEVLEPESNLLDLLTTRYFEKRNYLKGFLTSLRELERQGKAKIFEVRRLNYGSKFIEGHTLVIWKPL